MRLRPAGGVWVVAACAAWSLPGAPAQTPAAAPAPLATVAGASVQVSGAPVALNAQGRLQIFDGARLQVSGASAQLDLSRGGTVQLCGPARVDLTAGGGGALLIALDSGSLALRYAAPVTDSLLTPDFRVTTVVPPQQMATVSANASLEPDGTLCLTNRGSALSVQNLWNGVQRYVIGGDSLEFHPGGATTGVAACPCAAAPPATVTTPANAEGALFPSAAALTVGAPGSAPPAASTAAPATAHRRHNVLVRFLRWLF